MRMLFLAAACCTAALAQTAITGAPYSAEEVVEHRQTLGDGTHISQPTMVVKTYRDSLGRTRTERPLNTRDADSPPAIVIMDPVAGYRYVLELAKHVARRSAIPSGRTAQQFNPGRSPAALAAPASSAARTPVAASNSTAARLDVSRESLGTKTVSGVIAEGLRRTITYPAGAIGNDRPIVVTDETWTSPELSVILLLIHHDPRSGDTTNKVQNLSRAEPDPSLFQVPPDYEIIDQPAPPAVN